MKKKSTKAAKLIPPPKHSRNPNAHLETSSKYAIPVSFGRPPTFDISESGVLLSSSLSCSSDDTLDAGDECKES